MAYDEIFDVEWSGSFDQSLRDLWQATHARNESANVRHYLHQWKTKPLEWLQNQATLMQSGSGGYRSGQGAPAALRYLTDLRTQEAEHNRLQALPPTQAANLGPVPGGQDPFESFAAYNRGPQQQQQPQMGSAYFGIGGLTGRQPQQQGGGYGAQLAPMMNQAYRKVTGTIGLGSQSGSQYTR